MVARKRICVDHVSEELSPLPPLGRRGFPECFPEDDAISTFLSDVSKACPALSHLGDFGMGLEGIRRFLSVFAGQRLSIPSRRVLLRAWEDLQIRLVLAPMIDRGVPRDEVAVRVARSVGVPPSRVEALLPE